MHLSSYSELAVRLANTVGAGSGQPGGRPDLPPDHAGDRLATVDDLRALLAEQPRWRRLAADDDLPVLRHLRDELRTVFGDAVEGEEAAAVERLNALLATARIMPQITGHDGEDWHLHLAEGAETAGEGYGAAAVLGLAFYVSEHGLSRLGRCQSRPCANVFIDVSTNRSRRYCSERCATRANVAAYRARKRAEHDATA